MIEIEGKEGQPAPSLLSARKRLLCGFTKLRSLYKYPDPEKLLQAHDPLE